MIIEKSLVHLASKCVQFGSSQKLTPEGNKELIRLGMDLVEGNPFNVSERIRVLDGFNIEISGFNCLEKEACAPPVLICANHFTQSPAKIIGNAILMSHCFRKELGIEPYTVFGNGFSPVSLFRERAERATNIILVGGREKGSLVIKQALSQGKSLLLYPEGTNSTELTKGSFKAGRIILSAARRNVATLTAGIYFKPETGTFFITAGNLIKPEEILEIGEVESKSRKELRRSGQIIVDHVMYSVAKVLPQKYHGYYSNEIGTQLTGVRLK